MHTVGLELATQRLIVLPVMRDWYVVHRARKRLSPAAAAFKDCLVVEGAKLIEKAMV